MKKYLAFILLPFVFTIGCAPKVEVANFAAPEFTTERLLSGGVAVLPVYVEGTGEYVSGIESYSLRVGEELASVIRRKQPFLKVIGPTGIIFVSDGKGLMIDYLELIRDCRMVGTFSADISKKLSQSLGVGYFVFGRIRNLYPVHNDGKASFSIQFWSFKDAKLVFESSAEYERAGSYDQFCAPPRDHRLTEAASKIIDRLIFALLLPSTVDK